MLTRLINLISLLFALFQIYTAAFGSFPNLIQRATHLGFALLLLFLTSQASRESNRGRLVDGFWLLITLIVCGYTVVMYDPIITKELPIEAPQLALALLATVVVLEAARRNIGPILPLLAVASIAYAAYGHLIPGRWGHGPMKWNSILIQLYYSDLGIWGTALGVVATTVAMFIIFGSVLEATGGSDIFRRMSMSIASRTHGGPAQVAVVASSIMGTLSGSGAANVATTGSFTIPMMKRMGYKGSYAGAVEAVASTGGQIMPPVMGAGAFIMAEVTGIPYLRIMVAAIIPAILYYLGLGAIIEVDARRERRLTRSDATGGEIRREPLWRILADWQQSLPIILSIVILVVMLLRGYSLTRAGLLATMINILFYLVPVVFDLVELRRRVKRILDGLIQGGKSMMLLAAVVACANILIAMINYTGLGVKLSRAIFSLGQGNALASLVLTMIVAIILGMGVPTVAAYILAASVLAGPLTQLGFETLNVHLFIFYFAVLSLITPPVCPAVYIAASMAGAHWGPTSIDAVRLGLVGFIVPYFFMYSDAFLMEGTVAAILWSALTGIIGVITLAIALGGYMTRVLPLWKRILLGAGGIMLISPNTIAIIGGIAIAGIVLLTERAATTSHVSGSVISEQ